MSVQGSGLGVWDFGFRVWDFVFFGLRVVRLRVQDRVEVGVLEVESRLVRPAP